jgi:hypothetical protein
VGLTKTILTELKYVSYVIDSATVYAVGEQESSDVQPKFTTGRNVQATGRNVQTQSTWKITL